jgi:hypothetical protein
MTMNPLDIPDAISAKNLAAFARGSMPLSPVLPSLKFSSKETGFGGSDLYLAIIALIEQAENGPTAYQLLTAIRGLLGTLMSTRPPLEFTSETLAGIEAQLPPGCPKPTPAVIAALEQKVNGETRKLQVAFDILDDLHTIWLETSISAAVSRSGDPAATLERIQGSHGLVSDQLLDSLSISREQFDVFADRARAELMDEQSSN